MPLCRLLARIPRFLDSFISSAIRGGAEAECPLSQNFTIMSIMMAKVTKFTIFQFEKTGYGIGA